MKDQEVEHGEFITRIFREKERRNIFHKKRMKSPFYGEVGEPNIQNKMNDKKSKAKGGEGGRRKGAAESCR